MGIVNDYINKIINKINSYKYNKEKPWLKYYDRMPEHLNYYNGSMYDILNETSETRTCCGFRENMIQMANKPFDVSRL